MSNINNEYCSEAGLQWKNCTLIGTKLNGLEKKK